MPGASPLGTALQNTCSRYDHHVTHTCGIVTPADRHLDSLSLRAAGLSNLRRVAGTVLAAVCGLFFPVSPHHTTSDPTLCPPATDVLSIKLLSYTTYLVYACARFRGCSWSLFCVVGKTSVAAWCFQRKLKLSLALTCFHDISTKTPFDPPCHASTSSHTAPVHHG